MITATIFPGRYIQGYDAIKQLDREVSRFGKTGLLIIDPFVYETIYPGFKDEIGKDVTLDIEKFGGECCDDEIERLKGILKGRACDVVIGMGGGKTLDTAKALSQIIKVPMIIAPTIASSDAPCSSVSVFYKPSHEFDRLVLHANNPNVVLIDTNIVVHAPSRFLAAGMGDALATYYEAESCRQKYAETMTGYLGSMTAHALAKLCRDTLFEYGVMAKNACDAQVVTPAVEHIVEANTLLSGVGFESGGVTAAHAISNGFTIFEECHHYLHGEEVAFGLLAMMFLTDMSKDTVDKIYSFFESVGLPTTVADLGLVDATDEIFQKIAKRACQEGESIYLIPQPVTVDAVFAAVKAADNEGRKRKAL